MKTLEQIEADVQKLSPEEQERLRDWLENLLEDRLELKEEFKAEIEAAKKDIADGRYRVRKP
jgi:mRNA-degrading endonuclease RelE of RelBE toxin-antitoxin system